MRISFDQLKLTLTPLFKRQCYEKRIVLSKLIDTLTRESQRLQESNNDPSRRIQSSNEKAEETARVLHDKILLLTQNLQNIKAENVELKTKLRLQAPAGGVPPLPKSRSVSPANTANDQLEQRIKTATAEQIRLILPGLLPQPVPAAAAAPAPRATVNCPQRAQPAAAAETEIDRALDEQWRTMPTLDSLYGKWDNQGDCGWDFQEAHWQDDRPTGEIQKYRG